MFADDVTAPRPALSDTCHSCSAGITVASFPDSPHVACIVLTFELAQKVRSFYACEFKGQYYNYTLRGESLGTRLGIQV